MKSPKQRNWVKSRLKETGEISRNEALSHFVSRLSAIIQDLELEGYVFETVRQEGNYIYRVVSKPKEVTYVPVMEGGRVVSMKPVYA